MGKALYRKYRSKNLSEIVGQPHITTTLSNALKKGSISHAYLFTGPRGVGKTSIARILAHEVNGLEYSDGVHLDIIEIDAASNRRIDEIRDLREHVHTAPTSSKYKVYIIDEVHMLTKEAFNALLKTLEEPPEHVIFILATTEAHKLPETIVSRTQRFTFKPVAEKAAIDHLAAIAKSEDIIIDDEALKLIANHGQGSFRDSISLLDQISSGTSQVTVDNVRSLLGIAPDESINRILQTLQDGDHGLLLSELNDLSTNGYNASQIAKQISTKLRESLINGDTYLNPNSTFELLAKLIDVPSSHDPDTLLEIILLSACNEDGSVTKDTAKKSIEVKAIKKEPKKNNDSRTDIEPDNKDDKKTAKKNSEVVELNEPNKESILDEGKWQEALNDLKRSHNTLYGIARMAVPTFSGNTVTLTFQFPFHQKRFDDAKNKKVLADIISKLIGTSIEIICKVESSANTPRKSDSKNKPADLDAISNIFGSAEVIE